MSVEKYEHTPTKTDFWDGGGGHRVQIEDANTSILIFGYTLRY